MSDQKNWPDFIVVGAAKAGTTSLYHYLSSHPALYMSSVKEPHYFSFVDQIPNFKGPFDHLTNEKEIIREVSDYNALFHEAGHGDLAGECSNSYLYFPRAADQIKISCPSAKIIAVLRNPVERTYSHYRQAYSFGHETLSFEDALAAEVERDALNWRWHYQYRRQSLYRDSIRRYQDLFGREHVLVLLFEDLVSSPMRQMHKICNFLGIDTEFDGYVFQKHNETKKYKSLLLRDLMSKDSIPRKMISAVLPSGLRKKLYLSVEARNSGKAFAPIMRADTRERLSQYFEDDIMALEQLLEIDLSAWKVDGVTDNE